MLDAHSLRQQFPALLSKRAGRVPIFLDGPGGTQVPRRVIDAMTHYLTTCNANHGGAFATSQESDAILHLRHERMADLLNAPSPNEIVFGANMTTQTLHLSRALGKRWRPGDEIIVTRLDHDANVTPWVLAARDAGAEVRWIDIHPEDCTLDLDSLRRQLSSKTRLVAVGAASNATGTINDIATIARLAREAGARVFVDAVHFAPHGPIDVQAWQCDFLACSAYKFFGPHVGVLWGRRELLEELPAYKLRPVPETLPDRWMTGTQNHEGLAGVAAAVDYLADIGSPPVCHAFAGPHDTARSMPDPAKACHATSAQLHASLAAVRAYEADLSRRLLAGLAERPRFKVLGITDRARIHERVPTISITSSSHSAEEMARHLAARQIFTWHGNMYALNLTEALDLEKRGGFLRLGLVHYNTAEEIDELLRALDEL